MTRVTRRAISAATIAVTGLVAAGAMSAAATPAVQPAATTSSPWNQTDYNAAQSRANLAETTLTRATVGKIRFLRGLAVPLDPQACSAQVDSLALSGSSLYASAAGFVDRFDVATGHLLWRRSTVVTQTGIYDSIAVGDGLVVIGGDQCGSASDPAGFTQAFDAMTGKLIWTRRSAPFQGELHQLVVSSGLVVAAGFSEGSGPELSVRRIGNGALVWARSDEACNDGRVLVVAQVVIARRCGQTSEQLAGRTLANGALLWQRAGTWQVQRGDVASLAGRHVFATNPNGTIVSLNPRTGKTQFALKRATSVLAVGSAQVYAACGSNVCAYGTVSGSLRWRAVTAPTALAAEAGGVLYLADGVALNTGNGHVLRTLWHSTATLLAIGNGRIAVVTGQTAIDLFGLRGF